MDGEKPSQTLDQILTELPSEIDFWEIIVENISPENIGDLIELRKNYPLSLHSVSMNLAGVDPLDIEFLNINLAIALLTEIIIVV